MFIQFQVDALFKEAYGKAATVQNATHGFAKTGNILFEGNCQPGSSTQKKNKDRTSVPTLKIERVEYGKESTEIETETKGQLNKSMLLVTPYELSPPPVEKQAEGNYPTNEKKSCNGSNSAGIRKEHFPRMTMLTVRAYTVQNPTKRGEVWFQCHSCKK